MTNTNPEPESYDPPLTAHFKRNKDRYLLIGFGFLLGAAFAKPSKKSKKKDETDVEIDNLHIYIQAADR